jgi:hypothetical protein
LAARSSLRAFCVLALLVLSGCQLPAVTPTPVAVPTDPALVLLPTGVAGTWTPPARTKTSNCVNVGGLPDSACTPGVIDTRVSQANISSTICTRGYTATVRPPVNVTDSIKRAEMAAYGLQGQRLADYELDHLVSLELGGSPADVANLWPEPWTGEANAHMKDAVENYLHDQVCRGAMQLADAQRQIATDWLAIYHSRGLQPAP